MFRYYLKLGALSIRANPALSALMVAAIAIGIGACMTIFTIQHMMGSNPIPHKSEQLRHVQMDSWSDANPYNGGANPPIQLTYTDARNLLAAEQAVRQIATFKSGRIVEPEDPDELPYTISGRATSKDFFAMFDVPFKYGSAWDAAADLSEEFVAVISEPLNERMFGGEDSTGKRVTMNGDTFRIVGVLDTWSPVVKFYDLNNNAHEPVEDIFFPFSTAMANEYGNDGNTNCWKPPEGGDRAAFLNSECIWIQFWVEIPNQAAETEYMNYLDAYVEQQKELGRFPRPLDNRLPDVEEWMILNEVVDDDVSVLLGLAVLFLIVCLLNTIGLLLAKVMRRTKDISLRRALGASKASLFGQYIIEAGMIGVAGGLLGIGTTWLGLLGIRNLFNRFDFVEKLTVMDWQMTALAIALAVVSALAAALYPTWRACQVTPASQLRIQ
ncbi:MAG: ABC transporter permease [Woeseiaceae bacterium]|nr:ABC transporter permease [Woeseiaceae bacterium]